MSGAEKHKTVQYLETAQECEWRVGAARVVTRVWVSSEYASVAPALPKAGVLALVDRAVLGPCPSFATQMLYPTFELRAADGAAMEAFVTQMRLAVCTHAPRWQGQRASPGVFLVGLDPGFALMMFTGGRDTSVLAAAVVPLTISSEALAAQDLLTQPTVAVSPAATVVPVPKPSPAQTPAQTPARMSTIRRKVRKRKRRSRQGALAPPAGGSAEPAKPVAVPAKPVAVPAKPVAVPVPTQLAAVPVPTQLAAVPVLTQPAAVPNPALRVRVKMLEPEHRPGKRRRKLSKVLASSDYVNDLDGMLFADAGEEEAGVEWYGDGEEDSSGGGGGGGGAMRALGSDGRRKPRRYSNAIKTALIRECAHLLMVNPERKWTREVGAHLVQVAQTVDPTFAATPKLMTSFVRNNRRYILPLVEKAMAGQATIHAYVHQG